ncbi:MAG: hypothetical protein KTR31_29270 [Myxococcales bacterium]|nr:hypothetical protein [Myxococcales bacterium]
MTTVRIDRRFRGPPDSGNGGVSCGIAAAFVDGTAVVTLRSPPPLDTDLRVHRTEGGADVLHGDTLVASARPAQLALDALDGPQPQARAQGNGSATESRGIPEPVSIEEARDAATRFPFFDRHPFPTCFVCGPQRTADDGLCVHPGAVTGRPLVAAPWTPHASVVGDDGLVRPEIVWGALDCPSYFAFGAEAPFALLGRLTARIVALPEKDEPCVTMGWQLHVDGRKLHCASAVHSESRGLLAIAHATWITIPANGPS